MTRDAIQTAVLEEDSSLITQGCPARNRMGHGSRRRARRGRVRRSFSAGGFTLTELMIVLGIIVILSVLAIPAISSRNSANQITKAADTIKGVLEQARSYAQANNTYTWVGFFEEDASQSSQTPAVAGTGRLVMAIVASTDGTNLGAHVSNNVTGTANYIDPTRLKQIGALVKVENVHPPLFPIPSPAPNCSTVDCNTFDNRPPVQYDGTGIGYNGSRFGELNVAAPNTAPYETTNLGLTKFPFRYPVSTSTSNTQYTFQRTLRFSPTGESRINSTYDIRSVIEIGLLQTRGNATPVPISGGGTSAEAFAGNVAAVQIGGLDSTVKIYKR
jgi:prepilin-type N-terminal cleavage/methylation domain-containing protein